MDDLPRPGRAISPVVGVALMLVVVVLLSFTTGILVLGATGALTQPTWLGSSGTVHASITNNETTNTLEILHLSGSGLAVADLRVVVSGNGGATVTPAPNAAGADGTWSSGERLSIDLPTEQVCAGGADEVTIKITHRTGGGTYTITTQSYPVTRDQFVIEDGRVVPLAGYTATVELLGTAITYGAGGPSIPVYVDVTIGGTTVEPWGGDVNDGNNPRSYSVGDRAAGTEIAVNVTADAPYYHRMVSSTHDHSDLVEVLRDGDAAPSTQGFANQAGAGSFVDPYVDNGTITLEGNQAIYLFELGANDPTSPAADFQDAVVLVSVDTDREAGLANVTRTDDRLVCPRNASGS